MRKRDLTWANRRKLSRVLVVPMSLALTFTAAAQFHPTKVYGFTATSGDTAIEAFNAEFWDSNKDLFWATSQHNSYQGFWVEAELWEMVMDSYLHTSDPALKAQLRTQIDNVFNGAVANWGADWTNNHYNDDIMWWTMACTRAYQITGEQRYLDAAKKYFSFVYGTQWDTSFQNGGIWWMNSDHSTKNSCINFPAAETAIDLYNATKDPQYLDAATKIFRWAKTMLTNGNGKVFDRIEVANGVIPDSTLYNQGTFIGSAVGLYNATGDPVYLSDAVKAAIYTKTKMVDANQILRYEGANGDLSGGKTILIRNLSYLQKALQGNSQYQPFASSLNNWLDINAQTAWDNRTPNDIVDGNWSGQLLSSTYNSWPASGAVEALNVLPPEDVTPGGAAVNPYNRVEAESYSVGSGFITEGSSEGTLDLGGIQPGDYAEYKNVNFGSNGAVGFIARAASGTGGGNIEIRLDSLTGPVVGTVNVQGTGGWGNYTDFDTAFQDANGHHVKITGTHNVYLVFTKTNDQYLFNLDWFRFTATDPTKTDAYTRLKAGSFDSSSGPGTLGTDATYGFLNGIHNNAYTEYKGIDFGPGAAGITAHIASGNQGGTIEVKLDSLDGPTVGVIDIPALGSWSNWADIIANIDDKKAVGTHNVYLIFHGTNGSDYPCNLDWFTFTTVKGVDRNAYSKLEAENYTSASGVGTETAGGQTYLAGIYGPNHPYAMYNYVDFGSSSPANFTVNAASATSGGTIEVRIDSINGPVIAECPVSGTGGWQNFQVFSTPMTRPVTGQHVVYMLFKGNSWLYNFDKFTFGDASVFTQPTPPPTPVDDNVPPGEVENVQMVRTNNDVKLYWDGPYDTDGQKVELTVFENGQQVGTPIDVNRGVQTADLSGIGKTTDFSVGIKTIDEFGIVSKGITIQSANYPSYEASMNGNPLKDGETFDDYLPLTVSFKDKLHPIKSATVTIDGKDYPIDPKTGTVSIDLAGDLGAKTAAVTVSDYFGDSLQETFNFHVSTSVHSMQQLVSRFRQTGDLTGPLIPQLSNALNQVQHHLNLGDSRQAVQHMQDFVKLLNNPALSADAKANAKTILNTDAQWLIRTWQSAGAK
jgi:predicted alpha-1,6-mannanase (GH76 family)